MTRVTAPSRGPFCFSPRFSSGEFVTSVAAIPTLFGIGGPSTVGRLVVAVIVDAIQRAPGWARPHVSQERLKTIDPFIADADASSSPSRVVIVRRIQTAGFHGRPARVLARALAVYRRSMRQAESTFVHGRCTTTPKASTALGVARRESPRRDSARRSAVTAAQPEIRAAARCPLNGDERMESVAAVNRAFHLAILPLWAASTTRKHSDRDCQSVATATEI